MKRPDLQVEEIFHTESERGADYLELPLTGKAFFLVGALVVIIGLIAISRVGYLLSAKGELYSERAWGNINKEIVVPAPRGIITDRYGTILVKNESSFSVWVDVPKLLKESGVLRSTLETLAEVTGIDLDEIAMTVYKTDLERQPLVKIVENIKTDAAIELKGRKMSGVQVADDYIRDYIEARTFAHVVGYGEETGLEGYYNDYLKGQDGRRVIYRDVAGETLEEKQIVHPESGSQLQTTIDAEFQKYFYNRLVGGLRSLGRTSGVGVAINPQTGEVLALISLPSFDNNNVADYLDAPNFPFFNRAVAGEYNPGSTIKPLHAIAALREKVVTPEKQIFSSGQLELPNPYNPENPSIFLDWAPHGWVDVYSALARSSNVYFYHVGGGFVSPEVTTQGLGIERLNKYWKNFLLGQETGIDLPTESAGFLPDALEKESRTGTIWRVGDTYNVSIGQGDLLVTPVQLISLIASIGNGGELYQPFFVKNENLPKVLLDYSSWEEELKAVQRGLIDAISKPYGTARSLGSLPVTAAGKTGSAQVAGGTQTNAFFVGYAPAENPEIAVLVLIENALEGSLNAVPVARDVLNWYYEKRLR